MRNGTAEYTDIAGRTDLNESLQKNSTDNDHSAFGDWICLC